MMSHLTNISTPYCDPPPPDEPDSTQWSLEHVPVTDHSQAVVGQNIFMAFQGAEANAPPISSSSSEDQGQQPELPQASTSGIVFSNLDMDCGSYDDESTIQGNNEDSVINASGIGGIVTEASSTREEDTLASINSCMNSVGYDAGIGLFQDSSGAQNSYLEGIIIIPNSTSNHQSDSHGQLARSFDESTNANGVRASTSDYVAPMKDGQNLMKDIQTKEKLPFQRFVTAKEFQILAKKVEGLEKKVDDLTEEVAYLKTELTLKQEAGDRKDDLSNAAQPTPNPPVQKRGRGRPRKTPSSNGIPTAAASTEEKEKECSTTSNTTVTPVQVKTSGEEQNLSSSETQSTSIPPEEKRGPGRPRKITTSSANTCSANITLEEMKEQKERFPSTSSAGSKATPVATSMEDKKRSDHKPKVSCGTQSISIQTPESMPKRGRGRPKKIRSSNANTSTSPDVKQEPRSGVREDGSNATPAANSKEAPTSTEGPTSPKRGRGRPRKTPASNSNASSSRTEGCTPISTSATGNPTPTSFATVAFRVVNSTASNPSAMTPLKRRGRPRKTDPDVPEKRGRGRPRKTDANSSNPSVKKSTATQIKTKANKLLNDARRINMASKTKPYACTKCMKSYATIQGKSVHTRSVHEGQFWKCRYCLKPYKYPGGCRNHEMRIHRNQRLSSQSCEEAGKKGKQKAVKASCSRRKVLSCSECGLMVATATGLVRHMKRFHPILPRTDPSQQQLEVYHRPPTPASISLSWALQPSQFGVCDREEFLSLHADPSVSPSVEQPIPEMLALPPPPSSSTSAVTQQASSMIYENSAEEYELGVD